MPGLRRSKHYTFRELYQAFVLGHRSLSTYAGQVIRRRDRKLLDPQFVERLMLAVTQVNGCAVCSYAHTRIALKEGIPAEEVQAFISGDPRFVREEEAVAIAFAQHYADTKGIVDSAVYAHVLSEYGIEKTGIIVAAIQIMMIANIVGIPISALWSRILGRAEPGTG
jgi:AhpD family alkylhydroperoxidase